MPEGKLPDAIDAKLNEMASFDEFLSFGTMPELDADEWRFAQIEDEDLDIDEIISMAAVAA